MGHITQGVLVAHITVSTKKGNDHTLLQNYRPIFLLNTDLKIFAKILANKIKHLLPSIVHPDQTGFIVGRKARDNSIRALQLVHWARLHNHLPPYLILSTDAEKAFYQVDWDLVPICYDGFLLATLPYC